MKTTLRPLIAVAALATASFLAATPMMATAADIETTPVQNLENTHYAAGKQAVARKDWDAAVASFSKAVAQEPRNADALTMLAYSYRWQGKLDQAFANYERALQIDPKHLGALQYQGVAFVRAQQVARAEVNLAAIEKLAGRNAAEYRELSQAIVAARGGR